ncbi:rho GTPase-activating protein 26 [Exaiptasia diaphana]|uniref:Rho GTPase-activating protein 26 n=1 Tax=Exaiptasia diaphana TaxID=2652724 RepID=A0A913YFY7_EXADI|nr:rho GTPase-activating protein 26 [Exaiptasia diaphana]
MGLKPLEFADCLLDSPYFRENIHDHERELEQTNEAIKGLIKECKALLKATENLSKAQQSFAQVLDNFRFECIGEVETDDEILIAAALKEFASVIQVVEDERLRMINHANFQLIQPLEAFRKEQIGGAKDEKKKFDKQTEKFCLTVQNYVNMSSKKKETQLKEADSSVEHEKKVFHQTALDYVFKLQEVNETKKFQFVETLLSFMYVQMTFYHSGHEAFKDYMEYMTDLQLRLQNTRDRFSATKEQAETLMNKVQQKASSGELQYQGTHTRQGYLYVQEKRKGGLGYTWTKHYCYYTKENKILTMIPYVQTQGKSSSCTDTMVITSCTRKMSDSTDRRFCFDITALDRQGPITLQCLNEEDRKLWLEAMDGKEPVYMDSNQFPVMDDDEKTELGLEFIKKAIKAIETRGITDQGLYRIVGVGSKVQNVIFQCIEKKKISSIDLESDECEFEVKTITSITDQGLYRIVGVGSKVQNVIFQCIEKKKISSIDLESDECEFEVKTITSALKQYLRNMCPPVFTFDYHEDFLDAVRQDTYDKRIAKLKKLMQMIPENNRNLIFIIMTHLRKVAAHSNKNLMAASNLGVVFGPTLMKSKEESMAAIMNLKYQSVVIELLIKEYHKSFLCFRVAAHSNKNLMAASNLGVVFGPTLMKSKEESMAAIMNLKYQSVVIELLIKEYHKIFDVPEEEEVNEKKESEDKPPVPPPKKKISQSSEGSQNCIDGGKPPVSSKGHPAPPRPNRPAPAPRPKKLIPSTGHDSEEDEASSKSSGSSVGSLPSSENVRSSTNVQMREKPLPPPKKSEVVAEFRNRHSAIFSNETRLPFADTPMRPLSVVVKSFNLNDEVGKRGSKSVDGLFKSPRSPRTTPPPLPQTPPPAEHNLVPPRTPRKARSLYPCVAENTSELSFEAGAVISNVRESKEPGWLEGTISGRTGLIPANYVEYIT